MLQLVNLLAAGVPAPNRGPLPTCRPDPAYACDSRTFANGTEVCGAAYTGGWGGTQPCACSSNLKCASCLQ